MKILHLDSGREMRGGQWQVLRLHQSLLESGHESFLLARESGPLLSMTKERRLPCRALRSLKFRELSGNFDLVHAHDARSHSSAAIFSRCPFVVSRRVAFPIRTSVVSRWKYRQPSRYLAVSRYVARIMVEAGIESPRIDIVYDGVEIPTTPAHGDRTITPYSGDPAKGMALAKQAAEMAGVSLAYSRDLEQDLPNAGAMLYLTQSEGLGSGILLAMAHGVTVIASRIGGIPELIEDGATGILVENEAQSIATKLKNIDLSVGPRAREAVKNRFTVTHMVEATLQSYRKALND